MPVNRSSRVSPTQACALQAVRPNLEVEGPNWVNCRDPAVPRERQLHLSTLTNPPAQAIFSSVPLAGIHEACPQSAGVDPRTNPRSYPLLTVVNFRKIAYTSSNNGHPALAGCWGRTNLYFAAILKIHRRSEHDLVSLFDAVADLDLGTEVASFGDRATVRDTVLDDQHAQSVTVEDDCRCRHDQ